MKDRRFDYYAPIEFKPHPDFKKPKRVREILSPMPGKVAFDLERIKIRSQLDTIAPYMRPTYLEPLLNKAQEIYLFKRYNYLKYEASRLQARFSKDFSDVARHRFRRLLNRAKVVQDQIAGSNYRLAPKIVGQFTNGYATKEEALNEAYLRIWLTIPKFDLRYGWKFSTYCTYAIKNNLIQTHKKESKFQTRYLTGTEVKPDRVQEDDFVEEVAETEINDKFQVIAAAALRILNDMEKNPMEKRRAFAVKQYFGLLKGIPKILREISDDMSISKERVRQLKLEGLDILSKRLAEEGHSEAYEKLQI